MFITLFHIILPLATDEKIPGYKEYKTDRKYMAKMGDWRDNKDEIIPLDGIGGVSILVKADVHRAGTFLAFNVHLKQSDICTRYQFPMLCFREPSRDRGLR